VEGTSATINCGALVLVVERRSPIQEVKAFKVGSISGRESKGSRNKCFDSLMV